ncbi:MAG: hypothetical protein ACPGVB_04225 [Chitinophagales bacterium]
MPNSDSHFKQAKNNIEFLSKICIDNPRAHWDWKVTVAFYAALHLVNGHISKITGGSFRTHGQTSHALNPYNQASPTKIGVDEHILYDKLQNLSKRSRYLCSDSPNNDSPNAHLTYEIHFSRAIRNLDKLMVYFGEKYDIDFDEYQFICREVRNNESFRYWKVLESVYAVSK